VAELLLRAVTDDAGCAHQEALNAACQINDAVGHVMLRSVPFHRATAHILAVPAFDLPELLRAMRRQTSRAALQLRSPTIENEASRDPRAMPPLEPKDERHPDGPEGGRWLWWKGKRHDVPQGVAYRLLAYMWDCDSAHYDSLWAAPTYPVYNDPVANQTIRSDASELNGILKKIEIRWKLSCNSTTRHIRKDALPACKKKHPRSRRRKNP
jgi:hypothetical protein